MFRRRRSQPPTTPLHASDPTGTDRRDADAFAAVYARFADHVHAYALQRLRDPDLAADITSTVFTRALANLHAFEQRDMASDTAFEGWLLTIARNAIIDHVRANKRLTILDTDTYRRHLTGTSPDPASSPVAPDERERLLDALAKLTTTQQRIVLLRLQGWNGVEIADLLGMSHGAVRGAQHRAYARLRDLLTRDTVPAPARTPEPDHA
ncbi:MAG TPA: sigma-70 family RNA polymerase sigma factor [Thermomicrobiales bacterium]|nr:sigma-70 family RNA polymerase sigma factor [Thermomicrobiales bacterium]